MRIAMADGRRLHHGLNSSTNQLDVSLSSIISSSLSDGPGLGMLSRGQER